MTADARGASAPRTLLGFKEGTQAMSALRMTMLTMLVSALSLCAGCGGSSSSESEEHRRELRDLARRENFLRQIGIAYHQYHTEQNKGPATTEDLAPALENDRKMLGALKSGDIVFLYNVGLRDMTEGVSNTVLAYEKEVPEKSGLVLMGDGSFKKKSADEFKNATLAKPPKSQKDK
jgi:hypothetical protein